MKKIMKFLAITIIIFLNVSCNSLFANDIKNNMKIKLVFDNKEVVIAMSDNSISRQVLKLLPANFEFHDFANQEKIAYFKKPLLLDKAPRGMVAKAGKMFIYAPWGNMGIFYKDGGNKLDKNLIFLGEVVSGLEYLSSKNGNFVAKLEIVDYDGSNE